MIFSRNGHDFSHRFVAYLLRELPAKSAVLDCELVAGDRDGHPDFATLPARRGSRQVHLWAFLALNGRDSRPEVW